MTRISAFTSAPLGASIESVAMKWGISLDQEKLKEVANFLGNPASFPDVSAIALTFLAVTIPVFIFAVTLLGNAIARAREEEERTRLEKEQEFTIRVNDLQNKIESLRVSGDSSQLESELKRMKEGQRKFAKEVERIREKYSRLHFAQCVLIPGGLFLASAVLSLVSKLMTFSTQAVPIWVVSVCCLGFGIYRLSLSLMLVQEISASSEELVAKRMTDAVKAGLTAFERDREAELELIFKSPAFPYTCKPATEIEIDLLVKLIKGKAAHGVEIFAFLPDEFGLVDPAKNEAWQQPSDDSPIPSIWTVVKSVGEVHAYVLQHVFFKVKSPKVAGTFNLFFQCYAAECQTNRMVVQVIVSEK